MANHTNLNSLFTSMAEAIRSKTGSTSLIIADNFPDEINNLRTGFDYNNSDVVVIPDYAFYDCEDLNNVDCYNLTSVGANAFEGCTNLKSVVLYDGVETVGENTFKGCDCAIIYYKGASIPETWHENWNPDNRPVICGEIIETWDISGAEVDNVMAELYGASNEYVLYIHGNGNMKNFTSSGNTVSPWNSYRADIKDVVISDSVTSIGNYAFSRCSNLTSITIPNSVTSIGNYAFSRCSNLTSITIPNSVTSIVEYAFYYCSSLTSITIPNSVTSIGNSAFSGCSSLTSVTIPDGVTSIGGQAFYNCSKLTSITIPDSVTSIGGNAFGYCSNLTSITIPNSVTSIGSYVFYNCKGLISITIPDSVTSIGGNAFGYCSNLTSITYIGAITQWNAITLGSNWNYSTPDYTIHCLDGNIAKDGTITYH